MHTKADEAIPDRPDRGPPHESDAARERGWLRGIRLGQVSAFEKVYRAYVGALTRLAARVVRSEDAAHDVVHEVFFRVWRGRADLDVHTNLGAYLRTAVRHEAAYAGRRAAVERRTKVSCVAAQEAPAMGQGPRDPASDVELDELHRALVAAIARLPDRARLIARMRWFDRMSRREIADRLGISVATVNNQLTTAMRATRTRMGHFRR